MSCHSRSVLTVGSDATKNWKQRGIETLKSNMHGKILSNNNIKECHSRKQSSPDAGKLSIYILKFVLKSILDRCPQM